MADFYWENCENRCSARFCLIRCYVDSLLTISANCQANCKLQESIFSEKQARSSLVVLLVLKVAYFHRPSDLTLRGASCSNSNCCRVVKFHKVYRIRYQINRIIIKAYRELFAYFLNILQSCRYRPCFYAGCKAFSGICGKHVDQPNMW
jgi:hypothetical protein